MMVIAFCKLLQEEYEDIPDRSIQYFEELIWERFQRLAAFGRTLNLKRLLLERWRAMKLWNDT